MKGSFGTKKTGWRLPIYRPSCPLDRGLRGLDDISLSRVVLQARGPYPQRSVHAFPPSPGPSRPHESRARASRRASVAGGGASGRFGIVGIDRRRQPRQALQVRTVPWRFVLLRAFGWIASRESPELAGCFFDFESTVRRHAVFLCSRGAVRRPGAARHRPDGTHAQGRDACSRRSFLSRNHKRLASPAGLGPRLLGRVVANRSASKDLPFCLISASASKSAPCRTLPLPELRATYSHIRHTRSRRRAQRRPIGLAFGAPRHRASCLRRFRSCIVVERSR